MKRVLVCGGRDYTNQDFVEKVLTEVRKHMGDFVLMHGDANGADSLADEWARVQMVPRAIYPAQWHVYGNPAGSKRNQQMLDEEKIDLVVAFKGGVGTADMVRRAKKAGIDVWSVHEEKL